MPNESNPYATEAHIKFIIPNISKLEKVHSSEYWIQNTPWKLEFSKRFWNKKKSLHVYLHCAAKNRPSDWSQAAYVSIKLLPCDGNLNFVERTVASYDFRTGTGFGTALVSWQDLFDADKRFVKEDQITLDIKIVAENTSDQNRSKLTFDVIGKSCDDGCLRMFRLKISNINNLMAVRSPQFQMEKLPWNLTVYKNLSNLLVRLEHEGLEQIPYEITMTTTLVSTTKEQKTLEKKMPIAPRGIIKTKLASWEDLIDPQHAFINDNSIIIIVEIEQSVSQLKSCSCSDIILKAFICPICLDALQHKAISTTKCGHMFCSTCITHAIQHAKPCPMCNAAVNLEDLLRIYLPLFAGPVSFTVHDNL